MLHGVKETIQAKEQKKKFLRDQLVVSSISKPSKFPQLSKKRQVTRQK